MDFFILSPFLSLITSLILFFGCFELGKIFINRSSLKYILQKVSFLEFQYATFGIIIVSLIAFPFAAFTKNAETILQLLSVILIILGIKFLFKIKIYIFKIKLINQDLYFYLYIIIIFLYFILALSPLTAADVLDYHSGVALNILRFNQYILLPEWFTSLQAGHGEVLISLGFSVGAEQFGSLVQFSSLLCISGILIKFSIHTNVNYSKYFLILTILSCPILIFLLSGNKPQIFYSSILFLGLSFNFVKFKNKKYYHISYLLINILVCIAVMGKFSFNLTGFLVWLYSTINLFNKNKIYLFLSIPMIVFTTLFFPFIYWKYSNLGGNFFNYFLSPFPLHLPGYETFLSHNKGSQEIPFPNFLFYTSLSRLTEFLAANTIFFIISVLFFFRSKKILIIMLMSLTFIIVSNLYASPSARYYLDIILWLTIGFTLIKKVNYIKFIQFLFYPQIFLILIILLYSAYNFTPGVLSKKLYSKVKNNYAYMYSGFDWLNKTIPDNSKVIIINRPISQYKDFAVSGSFNYFTNNEEAKYYKKLLVKYDLDYLVYFGNQPDLKHLKSCVSNLYKKKNNVGFHATRNPFNKGSPYNAYIFKIDKLKLSNC